MFFASPASAFSLTRALIPLYAVLAILKSAETYTHARHIAWFNGDGFSVVASAPAQEEPAEDDAAEDAPAVEEEVTETPNAPRPERVDLNLDNPVEQDLLENLVKRRQELEEWSEKIALRENVLNATEKKIDRKIAELETLRARVGAILEEYEERENAKIARLVKIYENMRPKDAARIFNTMDNEVLLQVLNRMREAKAAPVLAGMQTDKVNFITERLLFYRSLGEPGEDANRTENP